MVLDSVRTVVIWTFSVVVGWAPFSWIQVIGFVVLLAGTLVYNALWRLPAVFHYPVEDVPVDDRKPLIDVASSDDGLDERQPIQ